MAPTTETISKDGGEERLKNSSSAPTYVRAPPPDNSHSIKPCSHLLTVFNTKAKSTVKSTYHQAISVVVANNRLLSNCSLYTTKKDGEIISPLKLSNHRENAIRCSTCESKCMDSVFICLQCPHVGCYTRHAEDHAIGQNHVFAIDSSNGLLFCYQCHDYTNHDELSQIRTSAVSSGDEDSYSEFISRDQVAGYVKPSIQAAMGIKGLVNLGSTCFMSCILQTMFHNPLVRHHFFNNDYHYFNCESQPFYSSGDEHIDELSACVTCSIDYSFKEMFTSSIPEGLGITNLLTTAWYKQRSLAGFQEQDAHEFWQFLLNEFHSDHERISQSLGTFVSDCGCVMHSIFMGELESSVACGACGSITKKIDPLMDLALEISGLGLNSSLYDCLDQFTRNELLDVKYKCGSCRSEAQAHRTLRIKTAPPVLSFQLKRFKHNFANETSSKIDDHIDVPFFLDLTRYSSDFDEPAETKRGNRVKHTDETKVYELFAMVNHMGSVNTGHYVTYIKSSSGQWLKFDDSIITAASNEEVQASNAYLLFYIAHYL